jgi:hypothetical protein
MTWFKVDDSSAFNTKVLAAGNEGWGAFCRVGAWCAQQLTDGRFSRAIAVTIAPMRVWDRLIAVGLVDPLEKGEMQMHDYLQRNPSKEQVLRERAATKARVTGIRNGRRNAECTPVQTVGETRLPSRPVPSQPEREDARAENRSSERGVRLTPVPPPPDPEPSEAAAPPIAVGRPPAVTSAEPGAVASGGSERPVELVDRVWRELWQAKYRRPYEASGRAFGPESEDMVQVRVAEMASLRVGREDAYLRHKFGAYLRDKGDRGYLDERCHPFRLIERDWAAYGEPKEPKRMVPWRDEPVELLSVEEMAARAAAAMTMPVAAEKKASGG